MKASSESTRASQLASMMFSRAAIEPSSVAGVEQHPRDRRGALAFVEDAHLEVDQLDVPQVLVALTDGQRSALSSAWTGPFPSAVRT